MNGKSHALMLTRAIPTHAAEAVHGVFMRMAVLAGALVGRVDELHVLGFSPGDAIESPDDLAACWSGRWGLPVRVTLAKRRPTPPGRSAWDTYGAGALAADDQENYWNIGGRDHVQAVAAAVARKPALVLAHRLPVFTPLLRIERTALGMPVVFDMDDIEHRALSRRLVHQPAWPGERLKLAQVPALMWRERTAIRASAATLVCSDRDASLLRRMAGCSRVHVLHNAVAPAEQVLDVPAVQSVGFIGSFAHPPNVAAARRLIERIWPLIKSRAESAHLYIAGAGAREQLGSLHKAGNDVHVLDFVPDLADFYRQVRIVCAPLNFGAGTKLKVIEAAAWRRPVVTTPIGAEGLCFAPGHSIVVRRTDDELASACLTLLSEPHCAAALEQNAFNDFISTYSRPVIIESLGRLYSTLLGLESTNRNEN